MEHNIRSGYGRRNTEPSISTYLSNPNLGDKEQMELIDNEILRVEGQIVQLVKHRTFLQRRRNTFSPAVKLPPEILAHIFEYACYPNGGEFGDRYYTYFPASQLMGGINLGLSVGVGAVTPLFIGTICNAWRNVSKSASQLWRTITIHMSNKHAEAQASLLHSWLQRSATRPLAIKLLEDDTSGSEEDEWGIDVASTAVINVLAQYSRQWHTIDFFLPSSWKKIFSDMKHDLPLLTNATLRVAENSPSMMRVDAFAYAPRLREVHLVGYSITDVTLPWAQLNRLDGEYFGVDECLETLRLCTDLQRCQFERAHRRARPFIAQSITHENLESFELIMNGTNELHALFGAMTLPNLKEIVLSFSGDEPLLREIVPLIRRSGCVLQHVHLVGVTPSEEELLGFLQELPMLQVFILINPVTESGGRLSRKLIQALKPRNIALEDDHTMPEDELEDEDSITPCLVPKLQRLEYQGAIDFTSHELLEFLVSRWRLPAQSTQPRQHGHIIEEGLPPIVSQLRVVSLTSTQKIKFNSTDSMVVDELVREGMLLEFLDDPNAD